MGENEGKERVRDCRGQQRIKLDLPWTRLADITGANFIRLVVRSEAARRCAFSEQCRTSRTAGQKSLG
jgi:hypothetical protein